MVKYRSFDKNKDHIDQISLDRRRLNDLIKILQNADRYNYSLSSLSSPIDVIINQVIDSLIILKTLFKQGAKARRNNPSLIFLEKFQDVLGNPKQISFRKNSAYFWDPQMPELLDIWINALVRIKKQKPAIASFMEASKDFLANYGYLYKDPEELNAPESNLKYGIQRAQRHWYRRQQSRNQKNHNKEIHKK